MTVPGNLSSPLLATAAADGAAAAGVATKSLRLAKGDQAHLSRTPSSAGNRKTFTLSFWIKRTIPVANFSPTTASVFGASAGGSSWFDVSFYTVDELQVITNAGLGDTGVRTQAVYRDFSSWYHFVVAVDTTNSTAADRIIIYVNGVRQAVNTPSGMPSQNSDTLVNGTNAHYFGRDGRSSSVRYGDNYFADIYMIDGSALEPTSFGAYDDNGVWQAATYSGTYGTNGFHLDFADSSDLGDDNSGNGNDFTPNNLSGTGVAASSAAVLNLPLNSTPFADSSASSATITNTGSISTTSAATNSFNISTVASLDGSSQRLTTNNNNISFQNNWTVDAYFIIDSGSTAFNALFNSGYGSQTSHYMYIGFDNSNKPYVETSSSGTRTTAADAINKNQWYHMRVIQKSGTITMYINGTSVLTKTAQTTDLSSQGSNTIGSFLDNANNANNFFGRLGPFRIINDALDAPSSGGEATSSGTLANTGTKTAASDIDSLFDAPTNGTQSDTGAGGEVSGNYCVLNPLKKGSMTLSNGNLDIVSTGSYSLALGTIGVSSGKWYFESTINNSNGSNAIGIAKDGADVNDYPGASDSLSWVYLKDGRKVNGSTRSSYGNSYAEGDVIGVALDADGGNLYFYKNGTAQNSGTAAYTGLTSGPYFPCVADDSNTNQIDQSLNFGQRPFAYSAPSGYKALCTTNLPTPTIADGSEYFDIALYTGTGNSGQTVSGLNFSPDFVWFKSRSEARNHAVFDTVRGVEKRLQVNVVNAEDDSASGLTAFNSDGFTFGSNNVNGRSGTTYAAFTWDAGSSTVSNTDGSLTSNVRANTSAGFSIVKYTAGSGSSNETVGHSLNAVPEFILLKRMDDSDPFVVFHKALSTGQYLEANSNTAAQTSASVFETAHTSSVFGIGTDGRVNAGGNSYIAYVWTSIAGFSHFTTFEGTASSDPVFVHCGFRPKWILRKNIDADKNWYLHDTARDTFNICTKEFQLHSSIAEGDHDAMDILSNGFAMRTSNAQHNNSGSTHLVAAFAENPFQANGGLAR